LPGLAPQTWIKAMQDAVKLGPKALRIIGFSLMLAGALLLQFLH
jgi:uncharacterized protein YjeT (DUF2065 family)